MNKVLFRESQRFNQWYWIVLVLGTTIPIVLFSIYTLFQQIIRGIPVGDNPAPNLIVFIQLIIVTIIPIFFFLMKLEVYIDHIGIHYRFFPIIRKERVIKKEEIAEYMIREYSAISEYGGWGVRSGFSRKSGKAYNVSGDIGLQLILTNDKKILFGTQKSSAIMYAMDVVMKSKND